MEIREPAESELRQLALLFDGYRVFYGQPPDPEAALAFLKERFRKEDSILFIARADETIVGFTQLYPAYSSVSMQQMFILNDLFVHPEYRGQGLGESLLRRAQEYCRQMGAKGLALETARDNPAQKLYERLGWAMDTGVFHYFWPVPPNEEAGDPS